MNGVTAVSFTVPERTYDRARATALFEGIAQSVVRQRGCRVRLRDHVIRSRSTAEGTFIRMPGEASDQLHEVLFLNVSANYLPLLEIPLRGGRGFAEGDTGQPAVIVNEAMAQAFWPAGIRSDRAS